MFYSLKDKIRRTVHDYQVSEILNTAPAYMDSSALTVLFSQLQHKDLYMFLVAAKTFLAKVPISHVHLLNDGTLTESDKTFLAGHFPKITFHALHDFQSPSCPTGGTWERLLGISELVKNNYVIQLDSDTLTVDQLPELLSSIENGIAFTLGTCDDQMIEPMQKHCEAAREEYDGLDAHVQQVAESHFFKLRDYSTLKYVRGCSGFAGFPKQSFSREFIEDISSQMEKVIGDKWREWGSEQVMSNIVIANIAQATVLPHPRYSSCRELKTARQAFIHFIGYCRFNEGMYYKLSKKEIAKLQH